MRRRAGDTLPDWGGRAQLMAVTAVLMGLAMVLAGLGGLVQRSPIGPVFLVIGAAFTTLGGVAFVNRWSANRTRDVHEQDRRRARSDAALCGVVAVLGALMLAFAWLEWRGGFYVGETLTFKGPPAGFHVRRDDTKITVQLSADPVDTVEYECSSYRSKHRPKCPSIDWALLRRTRRPAWVEIVAVDRLIVGLTVDDVPVLRPADAERGWRDRLRSTGGLGLAFIAAGLWMLSRPNRRMRGGRPRSLGTAVPISGGR